MEVCGRWTSNVLPNGVRGFIQAAQTQAVVNNHQQLTPLHFLKVLLDDKEGLAARLLETAGGDVAKAQAAV